ncbi:unnamed protein product [Boreogadus saida]
MNPWPERRAVQASAHRAPLSPEMCLDGQGGQKWNKNQLPRRRAAHASATATSSQQGPISQKADEPDTLIIGDSTIKDITAPTGWPCRAPTPPPTDPPPLLPSSPGLALPGPYYSPDEDDERPFICSLAADNGIMSCGDVPARREGGRTCCLDREDALHRQSLGLEPEGLGPNGSGPGAGGLCVNWNQYYTRCHTGSGNPHKGAINFDNIVYAWIVIFQVITLEGWVEIMYYVMDAHSFYNFIYFIFLIIVKPLSGLKYPFIISTFIINPLIINSFIIIPLIINPFISNPFITNPFIITFIIKPLNINSFIINPLIINPFIINPFISSWTFSQLKVVLRAETFLIGSI